MTTTDDIYQILSRIPDPEVPVLTILDLGMIRDVKVEVLDNGEQQVDVKITPTYTGCPAMDMIGMQVRMALLQAGIKQVKISQVLEPAWTTDWIGPEAREKLRQYGIAPPLGNAGQQQWLEDLQPACPRCGSGHTQLLNRFGSTACKALYQCQDCHEPFDYFKCH